MDRNLRDQPTAAPGRPNWNKVKSLAWRLLSQKHLVMARLGTCKYHKSTFKAATFALGFWHTRRHQLLARQRSGLPTKRPYLAAHSGKLDPAGISECYRSFVDPGFVAKASHALRQCFSDRADRYIIECFRTEPQQDRLYGIRNAINHGDIEAENLEELIRVEDKHRRLWMIVFGMLGQIIPTIPRPLDTNPH